MDEEVLVVPTPLLEELGYFNGFTGDVDKYVPRLLASSSLLYLPRSLAEDDPEFKQLIPYAVFVCGRDVYTYSRGKKGGEARLHDLFSLGVGGHICQEDGSSGEEAYQAGFARELAEEVQIHSPYTDRIVGLVHDDSTPVGQVHLGVVHWIELERPEIEACDPSLADAKFQPIEKVRSMRDRFETWSAFVMDHLLTPEA